ncbi:MAG TPA: LEA type 2 family protein [Methylibium sp.]|nr:LEA type 2 family protein [Methylibium sp.]
MNTRRHLFALVPAALALGACASFPTTDPPRVLVAGVEPLPGEGLELRFLVKLRIQNPNEAAIDFRGAFVELDLLGQPFASGVSDASGTVPRFGEAVLGVPVTVSALTALRQALRIASQESRSKLDYQLRGKLAGSLFAAARFESRGELDVAALGRPAPR